MTWKYVHLILELKKIYHPLFPKNPLKVFFSWNIKIKNIHLTRTKTSIRYAKEKERERKKGTRRDIERESEL